MSKQVCLNPVFMALRGNFAGTDEHGHKETFRFRETAWGTKSFGLGANTKRNLTTNPLSPAEKDQRDAFAAASAQRQMVLANATLRQTWQRKFQAEKTAGTTHCNTLNGYLMSQSMSGLVNEDGTPVD